MKEWWRKSRETVNMAEMAGRIPGEKPSSFSVTCSRLSQYLKEKGSFGDLSLRMTAAATARSLPDGRGKPETPRTMNLLPGMEAPEGDDDGLEAKQEAVPDLKKSTNRSMELFPQRAGFAPVHSDSKPDLNREPRAATAQMTMFYGGKVVVFDNFPADKAKELMVMAGRGCPDPAQVFRMEKPGAAPVVLPQRPSCPPPAPNGSLAATILSSVGMPVTMPQPPKVSLHRFLEKRKERINAKAPYQLNGPMGASASSSASPSKPEEARQWLGLSPQASKTEDLQR